MSEGFSDSSRLVNHQLSDRVLDPGLAGGLCAWVLLLAYGEKAFASGHVLSFCQPKDLDYGCY